MDSIFRKKSTICGFLIPALLIYTSVVFVPIIWSMYYSVFNWNGFGVKKYVGLSNYVKLLTRDRSFWPVLGQTFIYTILQILFQVGGGLLLAILLTSLRQGRSVMQTLYYVPVIISSVAISQIFGKLLSVSPVGLVNALLGKQIEWLTTPRLSLLMCAIVEGYKTAGTYMVIFFSALISVPPELKEAGIIDGANAFQCMVRIKLPYIRPIILTNVVLVLNNSLRSFDIPYLLTAGGPGATSELMASFMYKKAFSSMQYGYGSSIAVIIVIICFILAIFCMRTFEEGGN